LQIRSFPSGAAENLKIAAGDPGVGIDVGVLDLGVVDLGVVEAPAAARRAALELARRPGAVLRLGELLRARTGSCVS
jgi:hypothetical protein